MTDRKVEVGAGTVQVSVLQALWKAKLDCLVEMRELLGDLHNRMLGLDDGVAVDATMDWQQLRTAIQQKELELDRLVKSIAGLEGGQARHEAISHLSGHLDNMMFYLAHEADSYSRQVFTEIKRLEAAGVKPVPAERGKGGELG